MGIKANRCIKCLLTDSYPGITIDDSGMCNECRSFQKRTLLGEKAFLIKIKSKKKSNYDCVLGISGGKDSCYVAYLAKRIFDLKPLAVCYDFPFLCELARKNVKNVCESLGIDLKVIKSRGNLEYSLLRNHIISTCSTGTTWGQCLFCHYGIAAILNHVALENNIPFVLSGVTENELWNPGNRLTILFKRLIKLSPKNLIKFIYYQFKTYKQLVKQRKEFKLKGNNIFNAYKKPEIPKDGPEILKVFNYVEWNHKKIENTLVKETGWIKPERPLSWRYDCILEPMLDYTYKKEFNVSTVCVYLSGLVRAGQMERSEALQIMEANDQEVNYKQNLDCVFDFLKIPQADREIFYHKT